MHTKFKDVAHLYLPFLAIVDDRSYMVHGFTQSEDMFQVDIDEQDTDWWNTENFKPVLKSLSDWSDEEEKEYNKIYDEHSPTFCGDQYLATKQVTWMLIKGFDLFGLIESGQAVDVKSLTKS